ncbi:MAG TPA: Mth938-like domain-containing protein [Burkholderiaceae bacterium]|nr:Mth938-like domain-containing protein [Burkholderiaceae bacterium]
MKLHADTPTTHNTVTAYGPGFVEINRVRHTANVIVTPDQVEPWPVASFEALDAGDFERLRDLRTEVVLLGTGSRQRFPHPRLTRPLADARIGLEIMDTQAACRTYNILMAESRKVAAALLVENAG